MSPAPTVPLISLPKFPDEFTGIACINQHLSNSKHYSIIKRINKLDSEMFFPVDLSFYKTFHTEIHHLAHTMSGLIEEAYL